SDRLYVVRAPMVGTFFHAAEPGARPFVGVGDTVRVGQTIGILEVMKMMNTITAEVGGTVVELHTPDAHPVEFEQPLITIERTTENHDDGGGRDGHADYGGHGGRRGQGVLGGDNGRNGQSGNNGRIGNNGRSGNNGNSSHDNHR
ncbi:biotin/lipoyl-containing protein, partial [Streptomyces sp. SID3343]|uniref:acetyl-CoA carboxylase biotin carboxyl carrier protein n=1 Tax=Streptomyces sp. SID3343 TaxID=2690260 RepID=UPI0031F7E5BF